MIGSDEIGLPEAAAAASAPVPATPAIVIRPPTARAALDLRELWSYRELLYFFVWRDVKVRYKQTLLGAAWAILQPLSAMVVFSLFFGRLAGMPSDGVPYPIFAYAALVPWTFFATGVTHASSSLVSHQELIKKVFFPRLAIPVAAVLVGVLDFVLAFLVLLGMMLVAGIPPTVRMAWVPLLLAIALATALGAGIWLSALNVRYRDVQHLVPFVVQIWLFMTPVVYPSSLLPEPWRTVYAANPMVGVVEGFRWALLGAPTAPALTIAVSGLAAAALFASGLRYFRDVERTFADTV
jgi:lipopolysaccharide transport system permease protein